MAETYISVDVEADVSKACIHCGESKDLTHYGYDKRSFDGHGRKCKECSMINGYLNKGKIEKRFWTKVNIASNENCWLWTGAVNSNGNGTFRYDGVSSTAHRFSYRLKHGPIPPNSRIYQEFCGNQLCVNPNHLSIKTTLLHDDENKRTCSICGIKKTLNCFDVHSQRISNRVSTASQCKECKSKRVKMREYGITEEEYSILVSQKLCGICDGDGGRRVLTIDHDHNTKKVREMLCNRCNLLVGTADENIELLKSVIQYIERHKVG